MATPDFKTASTPSTSTGAQRSSDNDHNCTEQAAASEADDLQTTGRRPERREGVLIEQMSAITRVESSSVRIESVGEVSLTNQL